MNSKVVSLILLALLMVAVHDSAAVCAGADKAAARDLRVLDIRLLARDPHCAPDCSGADRSAFERGGVATPA